MSSIKLTYYGTVNEGVLKLSDRKRFDNELRNFEGKRIELVVQRAVKKRSNEQNRYLWGVVYPCALQGFSDAGHDGLVIEDVHDFFKNRFVNEGIDITNEISGETIRIHRTTTNLSTNGMMEYIDKIIRFCAEFLNVAIPDPMPLMPIN